MNTTNTTDTRDDLQAYRKANDANLTTHLPPIDIYAATIEDQRHVYRTVMRAAAITGPAEAAYEAAEKARRETLPARCQALADAIKAAMQPLE